MNQQNYIMHNKIDRRNILPCSTLLSKLIKKGQYIGIDIEFTGLGNNKKAWMERDISKRYTELRTIVLNHSILSLGLAFFYKVDNQINNIDLFSTATFELLLASQDNYNVSPDSLSFLVDNGFDINNQIRYGIPYFPGDAGLDSEIKDKIKSISNNNSKKFKSEKKVLTEKDKYNRILRIIILELISSSSSLILHNGLLDLMFLYHSFFSSLPKDLDIFLADIATWPILNKGSIYDTKCLADYQYREKASYLAFLFNKAYREQKIINQLSLDAEFDVKLKCFDIMVQPEIKIKGFYNENNNENINQQNQMNNINADKVKLITLNSEDKKTNFDQKIEKEYCVRYIYHGNCPNRAKKSSLLNSSEPKCYKNHQLLEYLNTCLQMKLFVLRNPSMKQISHHLLPFLLDQFENNNKELYLKGLEIAEHQFLLNPNSKEQLIMLDGHHTAPYDAFMTAYCFLYYFYYNKPNEQIDFNQYRNALYLMGKKTPLYLNKSAYSKPSIACKILAETYF